MISLQRLKYSAISFYCAGILTAIPLQKMLSLNLFLFIYTVFSIILLVHVWKLMKLNFNETSTKLNHNDQNLNTLRKQDDIQQ